MSRRAVRFSALMTVFLMGTTMLAGVAISIRYRRRPTVVASIAALPALWLAWSTYRDQARANESKSKLTVTEIADVLALAVKDQWSQEAQTRRIYDPYPLPVRWRAADPTLFDPPTRWPNGPRRTWSGGRGSTRWAAARISRGRQAAVRNSWRCFSGSQREGSSCWALPDPGSPSS